MYAVSLCLSAFLSVLVLINGASQMMTPETKGKSVVLDAVGAVEDSGIFPDDHTFLQRIAWVESKYGNDPNTYRSGYNGGIWQVDSIGFLDTQTHPTARSKLHPKIKQNFGIDWTQVSWSDLRKPFYSCLAARAKLYITGVPSSCLQAIPATINQQATYWKDCYNSALGAGTPQKFINAVAVMP